MLMKAKSKSEAAVKASFIVAAEIAKLSWFFNEGYLAKSAWSKFATLCAQIKTKIF